MPYYVFIALKNVYRDKRRSITLGLNFFFISFLLLIVFSLTSGINETVSNAILSSTAGHITISGETVIKGKTYQGITGYQKIESIIDKKFPDSRVITRYTISSAVYYKGISKRLSFYGIHIAEDTLLINQISLSEGSWNTFNTQDNAIVLPLSIANYYGLKLDDELLISTRSRFGAFNTATVQVRGISKTGNYFLRNTVLGHFGFFQDLDLVDSTAASKMYIFFKDPAAADKNRETLMSALSDGGFVPVKPASADEALNAISAASPRYRMRDSLVNEVRLTMATAEEVTGYLSQVIGVINGIGAFIASIMLFIVTISLFINIRMSINERLKEIGTLRAMGAERKDIIGLFIFEYIILCLFWVLAGIVVGLVTMHVVGSLITFPTESTLALILRQGRLVFAPSAGAMVFICGVMVVFTALFAWIPSRFGGKINPVDALNKTV